MKPVGGVRGASGWIATQFHEISFFPTFGKRLNLRQTKLECYLEEDSRRAATFAICFCRRQTWGWGPGCNPERHWDDPHVWPTWSFPRHFPWESFGTGEQEANYIFSGFEGVGLNLFCMKFRINLLKLHFPWYGSNFQHATMSTLKRNWFCI